MAHTLNGAGWALVLLLGCIREVELAPFGSAESSPAADAEVVVVDPPAFSPNDGEPSGSNMPPSDVQLSDGPTLVATGSNPSLPQEDAPEPEAYLDLAPPRDEPFDRALSTPLTPPPPAGWNWYAVEGAHCRDGSGAGLFIRFTESDRLLIVFEGGGVCTSGGFCSFNPSNVNEALFGDVEEVVSSALGAVPGRQQPGIYTGGTLSGIFAQRSDNPFSDWNIVYIPYCTGDLHFGTRRSARVVGMVAPQEFVGFFNTQLFVGKLAPTFEEGLQHVVVAGVSEGSFGAAFNFSTISDAFAGVRTDAIFDSGIAFQDDFWAPCQQQRWRDLFGFDPAFPPDCQGCFQRDGGGFVRLLDFLKKKHADARFALISSTQDEIIRLLFTSGEDECTRLARVGPVTTTLGQLLGAPLYAADKYEAGLLRLRAREQATGRLASYLLGGPTAALHQHSIRDRFFEPAEGRGSMAQFVNAFLQGALQQTGP